MKDGSFEVSIFTYDRVSREYGNWLKIFLGWDFVHGIPF